MRLRSMIVLVFIVLTLSSCTSKVEFIQPDLVVLQEYRTESIGSIDYEVRRAK